MGIHQALMGGSYGDYISLVGGFIYDGQAFPTNASATYQLNTNGLEEQILNGVTTTLNTWLHAAANAALYEVRVTLVSGTFAFGSAVGVWLNLGTTRSWGNDRNPIGIKTTDATVEIRNATTLIVLATASITVEAEVS